MKRAASTEGGVPNCPKCGITMTSGSVGSREIIMSLYRQVLEQIATGGPRTARKRLARALLYFVDTTLEARTK